MTNNLTTLSNEELIRKTEEWLMNKLNWCSCGYPRDVLYSLYQYLTLCYGDGEYAYSLDEKNEHYWSNLLWAYICDKEGWTGHGGSIVYAWLTDDGKELLKNISFGQQLDIKIEKE